MYIIKNAIKSITRSIGRNLLIGIIIVMVTVSSVIGYSKPEEISSFITGNYQMIVTNISEFEKSMQPLTNLLKFTSIFLWLVLLGSLISIVTISRYEPLKILSSRT